MRLDDLFRTVFGVSVVVMAFGILLESPALLALLTVIAGLSFALSDYFSPRPDSVNVISCYAAFSALWFGLGNFFGYVLDPDKFPQFHGYDVPEFNFEAQVIATMGAIVPLIAYDTVRAHFERKGTTILSRIGFDVSDRDLVRFCVALLGISIVAQLAGLSFGFLGTLGSVIDMGPVLVIFIIFSRWRSDRPTTMPRWTMWLAVGVGLYQVGLGLLYSNMRNVLIWPVAAFFLPIILNKRLTLTRAVAGVALVFAFAISFQGIGEIRGRMFGNERLAYLVARSEAEVGAAADEDDDDFGLIGLTARLSTFNQLTQVVRLVREDGYYDGETIGYAVYVFIPRVIWPEKPIIAPGQWFARRLGRGVGYEGGTFSNAINMTIPGELFLNFGWFATALGLATLGLIYYLLWQAVTFHRSESNPVALIFTYVLFSQAMFNGSHLGAFINLILWYISLTALTWALGLVFSKLRVSTSLQDTALADKVQPTAT